MKGDCKLENAVPTSLEITAVSPAFAFWHGCLHRWCQYFERSVHGVELASGRAAKTTKGITEECSPSMHKRVVAAAPAADFRCRIVPLSSEIGYQAARNMLVARRWVKEEQPFDVMFSPERQSIAVFTLAPPRQDVWTNEAAKFGRRIVALEPDVHALWRYAERYGLSRQPWLVVHPVRTTLFWPAGWPWGYHAEPLCDEDAAEVSPEHVMTAIRRACVMTGNDAPIEQPLRLAGGKRDVWRDALCGQVSIETGHEYSPVAMGAALKPARCWA